MANQERWTTPEARERVRARFGYGWSAAPEQAREYIERGVREAPGDELNRDCRPGLVRGVLERSFSGDQHTWLRRPTPEEIAVISAPAPDAAVYPSVDVYERLTCPLTVVLPDRGFYAARRDEVRVVVAARPERTLVEMRAHHNVPMARPRELARVIWDVVRARPTA